MTLTAEQIIAFTYGAVEITHGQDVLIFDRFYPEQRENYRLLAERYWPRCHTTTGIRIEFETDSRTFCAQVDAGAYEVLVDGESVLCKVCEATEKLFTELSIGNKHVTLMLPWLSRGAVKQIVLDEGANLKVHGFDHRFLFLGDSITQGYSAQKSSLAYVSKVARWFNADYLNLGVAGTRFFPQTLKKPDYLPDTVFIAFGTNDFNAAPTMQELHANCKQYMHTVKAWYPCAKIYCISPLWRPDENRVRTAGSMEQVCAVIAQQSRECGFIYVDGHKLVPQDAAFLADGLHPNDLGMAVYAEGLIKAVMENQK